ncbi:phage major capsid protein [Ancylobacter radicis]|uniref:Phage major capsid protein n=1 Tax=Ancylobacter radicis TaxID=2836179 RepID=A0ABS5R1J8_9HYPH|nr:phage major capsid protein [Ancylobacter radicis]MBS9475540.1 phage major capsid protein [Ancylobacter radicis]
MSALATAAMAPAVGPSPSNLRLHLGEIFPASPLASGAMPPARGIMSVKAGPLSDDPATVFNELRQTFASFQSKESKRIDNIIAGVDDINAAMASLRLSGGGSGGPAQTPPHDDVNAALRAFIGAGEAGPLAELSSRGVQASMGSQSNPDGGYTVTPYFSDAITRRIFDVSPLRRLARVVPVGTGTFTELVDADQAQAEWVGEEEARPETSSPKLGLLEIPARELYAAPKVTQTILDDANIDIATWLVAKVGDRLGQKEGEAFVAGDGVKRPRGFLTYTKSIAADDSRAWGSLQYVPSGHASAFASTAPADCLIDLVYTLKATFRPGAVWLMNRKTAGSVRKMKDGEGNYLWQNATQAGQPALLLGHPVELDEEMPDIGAGAFPIAFGDFRRGYTIVDRHATRLLRDPYSAKPHVIFYCYRRVGGAVNDFEAIKLLKISET